MQNIRFDWKLFGGIVLSCVALYVLFNKVNVTQISKVLSDVNIKFVALSVFVLFINYLFRAVRWKYLLNPLLSVKIANAYTATIIGYMANNILPARMGELVRAEVLARKENSETSIVLASLLVDRLWDGLSLVIILGIALFSVNFPSHLSSVSVGIRTGGVIAISSYVAIIILIVIVTNNKKLLFSVFSNSKAFANYRLLSKIGNFTKKFINGISFNCDPLELIIVIATSCIIWITSLLLIDFILIGFGIMLPLTASMLIVSVLTFSTIIPSSPGYIGTLHYACYKSLLIFNVSEAKAISIAIIIHAVGFFPVLIAGGISLLRNHLFLNKCV